MRLLVPGIVIAVLVALPALVASPYHMSIAVSACAFCVLAVGLNLVYGYVGLLSLCQVAFWGLSAYTVAILTTALGASPWLAVLCGGVVAATASLVVGFAAFRVSRHSFAITSLVFALVVQQIAFDWTSVTRGAMGIPGLPPLALSLPGLGPLEFDADHRFYYLILGWALVTVGATRALLGSRIGRGLVAIRENEPLAHSHGLNVLRYKLLAFAFSAFFTGIGGGLFCLYLTIVDPSIFDFYYTEAMLIMVIVGGAGSFWPVVASAVVFSIVPEILRMGNELRLVLYGGVLITVMLLMPEGIAGFIRQRRLERLRRSLPAPDERAR